MHVVINTFDTGYNSTDTGKTFVVLLSSKEEIVKLEAILTNNSASHLHYLLIIPQINTKFGSHRKQCRLIGTDIGQP